MRLKKYLGSLKRALQGIFFDVFEPAPWVEAAKVVIGESVLKQELNCFRIGEGIKKILFVSGMHGNEVGTVKLAYNIINWLEISAKSYKNISFWVIPCLNPDGYEEALKHPDYFRGGMVGRFNANNVDLNRNFDTPSFQSKAFWTRGKNYQEKVPVFSGKKANSEPEIRALINLIKKENIELVIAFHNAGSDIVGNSIDPSCVLTKIYSRESGFRVETDEEWNSAKRTGTFKEWCEINEIAFLEIEGSSRWGSDWSKQEKAIKAVIEFLESNF